MNDVPFQGTIHHIAMAAPAQFKSFLLGLKRRSRARIFMTLVAEPIGNRYVDLCVKQCPLVRSVHVMTGCAVSLCHGIIHMELRKRGAVSPVAFETERRRRINEEMVPGGRSMRVVTVDTSLLNRIMPEFYLRKGLAHRLMAAETELIPRLQEIGLVL